MTSKPSSRRSSPQNWGNRDAAPYKEPSVPAALMKKLVQITTDSLDTWMQESRELAARPYTPPADPTQELDVWQRDAFDALQEGESVVVDAPTTAGKTRVIEAFFAANIGHPGFRACYTCPVKSLSNDKVKEFRSLFGDENVGIATGDIKDNLNAPIVVATLETYRNSLLGVEPDLGRDIVIFDEYHYLMDISRGSAWEEAIILTPSTCQLLLLSASIANAPEFVSWIGKLHNRPCRFVQVEERPVPLADLVYYGEEWVTSESIIQQSSESNIKKRSQELKPVPHRILAPRLAKLIEKNLTPTIVYSGRRLSCQILAGEIAKVLPVLAPDMRKKIGDSLAESHKKHRSLSFMPQEFRSLLQTYGVAYHHSGLAPAVRVAVENLLKEGLLQFCTATMGLSLGINFSVRSALISDCVRPGEGGMTKYGSAELLQMLGRAGRRGKDVVGFSLWPNLASFTKMSGPTREKCVSRLKNDPTTFLGLVSRKYDLSAIEVFYKRSFLKFQHHKITQTLALPSRLQKHLAVEKLPCQSPMFERVQDAKHKKSLKRTQKSARKSEKSTTNNPNQNPSSFVSLDVEWMSKCPSCKYEKPCSIFMKKNIRGDLADLHAHLHRLGALDEVEDLTPYGDIARFFPHSGGLLVAKMIESGEICKDNLLKSCQLFASLSLARFKKPGVSAGYRFPYAAQDIEHRLEQIYPLSQFPEIYDPPFGRRNHYVLRDFHPDAGYVISEWVKGISWAELLERASSNAFAAGDITGLIFRTASYLQAISQLPNKSLATAARDLRAEILRDPLDFSV